VVAVEYSSGSKQDAAGAVLLDVSQPHARTQHGASEEVPPPPSASARNEELERALDLLRSGRDDLERDLESPIRTPRGILGGAVLGAILWAVFLGAGALIIYS
jgi:hypothetical protein